MSLSNVIQKKQRKRKKLKYLRPGVKCWSVQKNKLKNVITYYKISATLCILNPDV